MSVMSGLLSKSGLLRAAVFKATINFYHLAGVRVGQCALHQFRRRECRFRGELFVARARYIGRKATWPVARRTVRTIRTKIHLMA
jgi:hypothetical protein